MIFGSGIEMAIFTPGTACCQILPSKPISEPGSWSCCHHVDDVVFVVVVVLFLCLCCLVGHEVVVVVIVVMRQRRGYYQMVIVKARISSALREVDELLTSST